jgi:putative transposase
MKFQLIDPTKENFAVGGPCWVLDVLASGDFAWQSRPASSRRSVDLVLMTYIRSAFTLSNETYGNPGMTRELQDEGLMAGRHRRARTTVITPVRSR